MSGQATGSAVDSSTLPAWVTPGQVAVWLGVSRWTAYAMLGRWGAHGLKHLGTGRAKRYRMRDVERAAEADMEG